jgi:P-type Mg2+ transporter
MRAGDWHAPARQDRLADTALAVVAVGAVMPFTPLAHIRGFRPLPGPFFLALAGIIACFLALIELGKYWFFRLYHHPPARPEPRQRASDRRVHRRAACYHPHPAPG